MIERVAKVLRLGRGCEAGEVPCPFCNWGPDEATSEHDETGCLWLARAAIEAMREPTPEMIEAYWDRCGLDGSPKDDRDSSEGSEDWPDGHIRRLFAAMIDAALKT